jgi:DNA mismatch endonuclease (patch repair protein)
MTPSWASAPAVRARMQRQRTRDTQPELAIRRLLHAAGFRYRVDVAPLPHLRRRADIVFRPARVAVFIDGCFWHGCPTHGSRGTNANTGYWEEKVRRNQGRDADTDAQLVDAGWVAVRVWEHENPNEVAARIAFLVEQRRVGHN